VRLAPRCEHVVFSRRQQAGPRRREPEDEVVRPVQFPRVKIQLERQLRLVYHIRETIEGHVHGRHGGPEAVPGDARNGSGRGAGPAPGRRADDASLAGPRAHRRVLQAPAERRLRGRRLWRNGAAAAATTVSNAAYVRIFDMFEVHVAASRPAAVAAYRDTGFFFFFLSA
jgi:hypothetical protein